MGGKLCRDRSIIINYKGEVTAMDIRVKVLELLLEDRKRGIAADDGLRRQQHRNICEREQRR